MFDLVRTTVARGHDALRNAFRNAHADRWRPASILAGRHLPQWGGTTRLRPRRLRWTSRVVAAAAVIAATAPLGAHDFWIEPTAFRPAVGSLIGLRLLVGEQLLGDPVVRESAFVKRFVAAGGSAGEAKEEAVPGREGGHPAGLLRVTRPGLLVVGYQSLPRAVELTPETFDKYLGEEGLDEVRALLPGGRPKGRVHELYSRCAKSLLSTGPATETDHDRPIGLPFELVAERNPYSTGAGGAMPFRLVYQGRPKANALVVAIAQKDPSVKLTARSDAQGRVTFTFPVAGVWLVKAVHMTAAKAGAGANWESYWASTTFELPQ